MEMVKIYAAFFKKHKKTNILFALLSIREPVSLLFFFWFLGQGLGLAVPLIFLLMVFTIPIVYSLYSIRNFKELLRINNKDNIASLLVLMGMNFLLYALINIATLFIMTNLFRAK